MKKTAISLVLLSAAVALNAQGFVPFGGAENGVEHAIDAVASGYASNGTTLLSHGMLSAAVAKQSGITAVESGSLSAYVSADGSMLAVIGTEDPAVVEIFSVDGRKVLSAKTDRDGCLSLSSIASGHYIVRIASASAAPFVKRFFKRQ